MPDDSMPTKGDYVNSYNYFKSLFYNSRLNAVLVMTLDGTVLSVNGDFTSRFGYDIPDITGKNFSILFTENDRAINRPANELANAIASAQADDKNYLVKKNGHHPVL